MKGCKENTENTKQIKNIKNILRKKKENVNRYFEELLNVECERQIRYSEEEDIYKQEEAMRDEAIIIEELTEAIHALKRRKVSEHDNITVKMLRNLRKKYLKCCLNWVGKKQVQKWKWKTTKWKTTSEEFQIFGRTNSKSSKIRNKNK